MLDLSARGLLTRPSPTVTFNMGTGMDYPVMFTRDGVTGLVSQDDGSIGVFNLRPGGAVEVVHAAYTGGFYAGGLLLSEDSSSVYVLDADVRAHGGGVYELGLACNGSLLGPAALVVPGAGATAMALVPGRPDVALLAATAAFDSPPLADTHLVDLVRRARIASAPAFGDGAAIVSAVAVAPDGTHALIADDGMEAGNRLAAVSLTATNVSRVGGLLVTPSPDDVAVSPFDNAAFVLNGDSNDQIHVLSYAAGSATAPFVITGELVYKFPPPQIPTTASVIRRGALTGAAFVGEVSAVRQLQFTAGGGVEDAAQLVFPGGGLDTIVGVVGVEP